MFSEPCGKSGYKVKGNGERVLKKEGGGGGLWKGRPIGKKKDEKREMYCLSRETKRNGVKGGSITSPRDIQG